MCCSFSPSGKFISAGSLDNVVTLYKVGEISENKPSKMFRGHTGFISAVSFQPKNDKYLISTGDMRAIYWDLETGKTLQTFKGHSGDILTLSVSPNNENLFVTGSTDTTCRVWDIKSGKCIQSFHYHESDVNSVQYFPSGLSFGTGSEDGYSKLIDLRAERELCSFPVRSSITSVSFSNSGKYFFTGSFSNTILVWDTLRSKVVQELVDHKNRISNVTVGPTGMALASSSWDNTIKIWA